MDAAKRAEAEQRKVESLENISTELSRLTTLLESAFDVTVSPTPLPYWAGHTQRTSRGMRQNGTS